MRLAEAAPQFEKDRGPAQGRLVRNRRIGVAVGLVMAQPGVSDVLAFGRASLCGRRVFA